MNEMNTEPGTLHLSEDYFDRVVPFLAKFNWMYDFKVTEFFTRKVWQQIPSEVSH